MFTVKHTKKANGATDVFACDGYEKVPVDESGRKTTRMNVRSGKETFPLTLAPGDVIYVENIKGKTIDVLKGS